MSKPVGKEKKALGNLGEAFARGYFKEKGYQVVQAPFRCRSGEIDAIVMDGTTLVFFEVKTRRSMQCGGPLAAVTPAKQRQIAKTAQVYLSYFNRQSFIDCRFDVLGILVNPSSGEAVVDHVKDAFRLDGSGRSFSC